MSARKNNKKQMAIKPYCKVCHDAGKSEKEYTSHFVKSAPGPEGKVVCPTLLSQSCGYCGSCGHTPKFCPTLAAEKAAEEKALKQAARRDALEKREAEKAATKPAASVKKPQSGFAAAFGSDSDSETEKKVSKKVSAPTKSITNVTQPAAKSVASAAKLAPKLIAKVDEFPALPSAAKSEAKIAAKPAAKTGFLESLNQVYPELKVAKKMPEINTYRGPPIAQLVRRQSVQVMEEPEDTEDEFPEPSDFTMADFVEAAYQRKPTRLASEMDWAMTEDSDSDEDW